MLADYTAVQDYLYQLGMGDRRKKYGIERMASLAEALDQPQGQFPIIHVAGTNGKGSTCAMLEAIYRRAGYRTGLYTSPHLVSIGERIQVNGQALTPSQLTAYTNEIKTISEHLAQKDPEDHPSFFEFMTGMALLHFCREQVDIAFIETGLGGRLDATNIVDPELAIITSISLDHTHILGETLSEIATEKAGIIKPGKPVVCGRLPQEADTLIQAIARQRQAAQYRVEDTFGTDERHYPKTNLAGRHQGHNAATATLAVQTLQKQFPVADTAIKQALQTVDWPGRWQAHSLVEGKTLIVDTSHNLEGFIGLAENLESLIAKTQCKPIIIAAAMGEDRAQALVPILAKYTDTLIFVQPGQERACPPKILQAHLPAEFKGQVRQASISELFPQPDQCTLGERNATIVATGSIYLAGEVIGALSSAQGLKAEHHLQDRP